MIDYSFENFHRSTFADFKFCERPKRSPDFYSFSGSTYWDFGDHVVRWSNHWGRDIRSCCWYLDGKGYSSSESVAGMCFYSDFKPVKVYFELFYSDWSAQYG